VLPLSKHPFDLASTSEAIESAKSSSFAQGVASMAVCQLKQTGRVDHQTTGQARGTCIAEVWKSAHQARP
jgi:hypothetical protein